MFAEKIFKNFFWAFLLFCLSAPAAFAEFVFSPLSSTIEASEGFGQTTVVLSNPSDKPTRLQINFSEWQPNENNSPEVIANSNLTSYLKASPQQLTLQPFATQNIRINCSLPKDLPNKEYKFFMNILEVNNERGNPEKNNKVNFKMNYLVSSALYVHKGKNENYKPSFELKDMVIKKKGEKFKYELVYANSGNQHIRENLKIRIYDLQNEVVAERQLGSFIAFPTEAEKPLKVSGDFALTKTNEISAIEFVLSDSVREEPLTRIFDL